MYNSEILLEENPYRSRRRRSRRNPTGSIAMPKNVKSFFQGVSFMDAGLALGGFAGATMLPGIIVKGPADTTGKKVGKVLLAFGSTGIVGLAAKSVGGMSGAQAAVAGGLAGALAQSLSAFAGVNIGTRALPVGRPIRRIGNSTVVSPSMTREGETVSMITP